MVIQIEREYLSSKVDGFSEDGLGHEKCAIKQDDPLFMYVFQLLVKLFHSIEWIAYRVYHVMEWLCEQLVTLVYDDRRTITMDQQDKEEDYFYNAMYALANAMIVLLLLAAVSFTVYSIRIYVKRTTWRVLAWLKAQIYDVYVWVFDTKRVRRPQTRELNPSSSMEEDESW
jgi:hypothetical protein